jgi:hypothetical protein
LNENPKIKIHNGRGVASQWTDFKLCKIHHFLTKNLL